MFQILLEKVSNFKLKEKYEKNIDTFGDITLKFNKTQDFKKTSL